MKTDLSPQIFDLLVALSHGPQHGYALMQRIETMHEGNYKPSSGVIYANLQRLVDWGWCKEVAAPGKGEDTRRKHYQATETGLGAARAHVGKQQEKLKAASRSLRGLTSC